jgi:hypothetical protein
VEENEEEEKEERGERREQGQAHESVTDEQGQAWTRQQPTTRTTSCIIKQEIVELKYQ